MASRGNAMSFTYDPEANAVYVYLSDPPAFGSRADWTYACDPAEVGGQIHLDFNDAGELVGVEILDAREKVPALVRLAAGSD